MRGWIGLLLGPSVGAAAVSMTYPPPVPPRSIQPIHPTHNHTHRLPPLATLKDGVGHTFGKAEGPVQASGD